MPSTLAPVPSVAHAQAYRPPSPSAIVDLQLGGTERPVLSEQLRQLTLQVNADVFCRYPDAASLRELLARRFGIAPAGVLVTAGSDEAIDRACRAFLGPGDELVAPTPTFEMISHYAGLTGATVRRVAWTEGDWPLRAVLAACGAKTRAVAVVTPNNPSGAVATAEDLEQLAKAQPQALVLVDMAYGEYADEDITPRMLALPNVVMTRTLSKAWGMPGLRVGYALGAPDVIGWMTAAGGPYAVSRPSLTLASAWLQQGEQDMRGYVTRIRQERALLRDLLVELGARVEPSQANFVLARFDNPGWVRDALHGLGIGVRAFPTEPSLSDALRITCPGDAVSFERLLAALRAVLRPAALLWRVEGGLFAPEGHLRVDPAVLRRLAGTYRLGAISAQAEGEVSGWLRRAGIAELFPRPISVADASAAGDAVALCQQRAHAGPAWMVVGSADDVPAARGHGVVPIALAGSADAPGLEVAGVARTIHRAEDLLELHS